jgi:hypothetical protein
MDLSDFDPGTMTGAAAWRNGFGGGASAAGESC